MQMQKPRLPFDNNGHRNACHGWQRSVKVNPLTCQESGERRGSRPHPNHRVDELHQQKDCGRMFENRNKRSLFQTNDFYRHQENNDDILEKWPKLIDLYNSAN